MKSHEQHESDSFNNLLRESIASEPLPPADPSLREALLKRLDKPASPPVRPALSVDAANRRRTFFQRAGIALVSTAALALVAVIWQRPNLEMISWTDSPPAVQTAQNPQPTSARTTSHFQDRPAKDDGLAIAPIDELQKVTIGSPDPNVATGVLSGPAREETATYAVPGLRDYSNREVQVPGASDSSPSVGSGGVAAGYGEANPLSGPTGMAGRLPQKGSGSDSYGGQGFGGGSPRPTARPGTPPGDSRSPRFHDPLGEATESAPASVATRPATASSVTTRILVQDDEKARTGPELESKSGSGQGQPAGLTPAQQPGQPNSNFYNESTVKSTVAGKELKEIEDRISVDKSEGLTRQLAAANEALLKQRAVDGERREKFNKVATLTEEINRSKRLSDREPRVEQEQLAKLEKAIEEAREVEARFRVIPQPGGEQYARIVENQFLSPATKEHALSTFAIDVDTASYANVRRFLNNGQLPPPDAVRIEEFVNYFKYKYPQPKGDDPFSVNMEMADCPWHPGHKLLRVGLQGKEIHRAERPASNLVFLIDTSGSMTDENKLPLLKSAFTMLVGELNENDKVTIVTYAGNAGLRLPPTRGHEKESIIAAINGMQSGGSTHGSAGIKLAYEIAAAQFIKDGTNKVILATDGDLNVGITDDAALVELISKKAETGVYLTVLGVGTGNLKDAKMERLADNGNGIYAYLDSVREAQKVLVEEMSGSLVTIAKDVKIQLEFNPAEVQSYRLLGYENRVMANKDFRNDQKDAGEIGAGHSVTALYEVVLTGSGDPAVKAETPATVARPEEELTFQRVRSPEKPALDLTEEGKSGKLAILRLRYKKPEAKKEDKATELKFPLKDKGGNFNSASQDFQFASAVVAFGLTLRNSEFRGGANLSAVAEIATAVTGDDVGGHRAEFLDLVRRAKTLRGE